MNKIDDSNFDRYEWESLIERWIFSELDRKILKRRLLDEIHFEPLAEELEMSVNQVKNRFYKAEKKLFKHI